MQAQEFQSANYLDIIFENRNKAYGAYFLRKNYHKRMFTALSGILLLGFAFAVMSLKSRTALSGNPIIDQPYEFKDLLYPPPIIPPVTDPTPSTKNIAMVKNTTPVIVTNLDDPKDLMKSQVDLKKDITIGSIDNPDGEKPGIIPSKNFGSGGLEHLSKKDSIAEYVSQMPEFPGNLNKYLASHINYPEHAIKNNIEGKVILKFVVDENGNVSHINVLKGIGYGCNEEAVAVASKMPKWKPGKQNGKAVKVYFTLPIQFVLE